MPSLRGDPVTEANALLRRLRDARAAAQIALAEAEVRVAQAADEELGAVAAADRHRQRVRYLTRRIDDALEELHEMIPRPRGPLEP